MPPKHPQARYFLKARFFDGLTSFSDLKVRISTLQGEPKIKGDAFEVFVEAYLNTHRQHFQCVEVWPGDTVPSDVLERLGLPETDFGVDGVYRTTLGEYHGYQVKFRSAGNPCRGLATIFRISSVWPITATAASFLPTAMKFQGLPMPG